MLESIGNVPPAERESAYHRQLRGAGPGGLTQAPEPPENQGRFSRSRRAPMRCARSAPRCWRRRRRCRGSRSPARSTTPDAAINLTGTIAGNLPAGQQLPTIACAAGQIPKWNGSAWTCAADDSGGIAGGAVEKCSPAPGAPRPGAARPRRAATSRWRTLRPRARAAHERRQPVPAQLRHRQHVRGRKRGQLPYTGSPTPPTATGLNDNTTGVQNTASRAGALGFNSTGDRNIAIGYLAGHNLTTGNDNIAIGNEGVAGESGTIRLGDPSVRTKTLLVGNVGIGTADTLLFAPSPEVVANAPQATVTTTRSPAAATNDAVNPFALDVKIVGAPLLADRGAMLQNYRLDPLMAETCCCNRRADVMIGNRYDTCRPAGRCSAYRIGTSGTNGCIRGFDGTGIAGTCSSDLRFKRDVTAFPDVLARIAELRPVNFYSRADEFPPQQFGSSPVLRADRAEGRTGTAGTGERGCTRLPAGGLQQAAAVDAAGRQGIEGRKRCPQTAKWRTRSPFGHPGKPPGSSSNERCNN